MTKPTFVELFAGVGGLSMGLETAGWQCKGHAEWDAFPRKVLKHRWPDVPLWGDVSKLNGADIVAEVGPFDMLTFGAPCQDFSIAGDRKGMAGERSVLVLEAMRIWRESGAPLALYENVVGMLSSNNGADFAGILSTFVGATVAIPTNGWRGAGVATGPAGIAAWRTLDSRYFGVPHGSRRVFVLCTRTGRIDPSEVLAGERIALDDCRSATRTDEVPNPRICRKPSYYQKLQQGTVQLTGAERFLTPLECERLQGWPDNYTNVQGATEAQRYRAIGNGVASPVAAWIGHRLREAIESTP